MTYVALALGVHHEQLRTVQERHGFLAAFFLAEVFLLGSSLAKVLVIG